MLSWLLSLCGHSTHFAKWQS